MFTGTARVIDHLMRGSKDEFPAQVLRIIGKTPNMLSYNPHLYYTIHEKFAPASIILKPGVHLVAIDQEKATFIQVDEDCCLFNPRLYPITFFAQTDLAKNLIILPIGYLNDITEKIDISDRKVVWMFHTGRCGTTAWVQAFNSLPGWTVFSELQALRGICLFGGQKQTSVESFSKTPEFRRLALAMIKLYIRLVPSNGSLFWKTGHFAHWLVDIIAEEFPEHKMLLAYRDAFPSMKSYYNSFDGFTPIHYVQARLTKDPYCRSGPVAWERHFVSGGCNSNTYASILEKTTPQPVIEWLLFNWAVTIHTITNRKHANAAIRSVKYEQLKGNRRETIAKVFNYVNVAEDNVGKACEALDTDSQQGLWLSKESRTQRSGHWIRQEDVIRRCNVILDTFNLPDVDSTLNLNIQL